MRPWWSVSLLALALLSVAAPMPVAAAPAPFTFEDERGDVLQGGKPAKAAVAPALDIQSVRLEETATGLDVHLRVAEPAATVAADVTLEYSVGLVRGPGDPGLMLRARYHAPLPVPAVGLWSHEVMDRATGQATPLVAPASPEGPRWSLSADTFGLRSGTVLAALDAQAWGTPKGAPQVADFASTTMAYRMGAGAVEEAGYEPGYGQPGAWTAFTDPAGDVDGGSAEGEAAADVLAARVSDDGSWAVVELELRSLAGIAAETAHDGFHAQYALCFEPNAEGSDLCFRATFGGREYTGKRDGAWEFGLHDARNDAWPDAEGYAIGDSLVWYVPLEDLRLRHGSTMSDWGVQSWNSYEHIDQYGDWGQGLGTYTVGSTAPQVPRPPPPPETVLEQWPADRPGAWQALVDDVGDVLVTSENEPYDGPSAGATDVVRALVWEEGSDLHFELELADLASVSRELDHQGYHVQYALSFVARDGHDGYSMRATFGGKQYTGDTEGSWRFNVHDQEADEWPRVDGAAVGNSLLWRVPRADLGIEPGDSLREWHVSTWASFEHRDQFGDRADGGDAIYVVGEPRPEGAAASAAGAQQNAAVGNRAGAIDAGVRDAAAPGVALALILGATAWAGRSRRPE